MLIAGFQKTSFIDYPGQVAAVVFTPYCNYNCTYCHNAHIIHNDAPLLEEQDVLAYLEKRKDLLKAVVVSGGEPTLQQNLQAFLRMVKSMGYLIKLDTNGAKPQALQQLARTGLCDYVAMDVKAPPEKYALITRTNVKVDDIRRSIAILRNSGIAHEFRMTFAPALTQDDAVQGAQLVKGCERFYLQQYRPRSADDPRPHAPSVVMQTAERIREAIGVCAVRGLGAEQPI